MYLIRTMMHHEEEMASMGSVVQFEVVVLERRKMLNITKPDRNMFQGAAHFELPGTSKHKTQRSNGTVQMSHASR